MATSDLVHLRTPPFRLQPGQEWWTDNRHQLLARLRTEARRGTVQPVMWRELAPGFYGALVIRRKPRPSRRRRVLIALAAVVPVTVGVVMLLVELVQWVMAYAGPVLILLAAGWFLTKSLCGHRATCAGLHCSGCKN